MPNRFSTCTIIILILFWGLLPLSSYGAESILTLGPDNTKEPWELEADELSYDKNTDIYTASGNVVIKKEQRELKCDYAQVDQKTMIAQARGHVEFKARGDELRGDELTFDLNKQTGEVKNGRLFLKSNNFHVTGEEISKTGESSYRIKKATVTSCDGEEVPWEIKAKELSVTIEGYGQAWHSSFRVRNVPIFYFPYLIFPAKTKRQSGFLIPDPGYSTRDGLTFNLPYFWVLSDNADVTLNGYYMGRRGFMPGMEFRYVLSPYSKGTFLLDYLLKDEGSEEEFKNNNIKKSYEERYWFRSKLNQRLPGNADFKMDLDWVSDQDYLKEFHGAPNGLDQNRRTFIREFSRDLDDETQLNRRNTAVLTKTFGTYQFTGGFNYYQELDETNDALNQLPYARFDGIKQVLWKNIYYQWNSSFNNYWREKLDRGQVLELNPTLYYPLKLRNYLNLEASLGLTGTLIQVDNKQSESVDSLGTRTVPSLRLDLSTDIQKIFDVSGSEVQKIKHNIRPQIVYNYVPEVNQNSLPTFVSPISKANTLTYYLINTFTAKSLMGKGGKGEDLFGYRDFLQFKLYQSYDLNEAQRSVVGSDDRRPFSNVTGEIEILPLPYLTFRSAFGWSPYSGKFDSQSYNLTVLDKKGNRAYLEYLSSSGDQYRQVNANLSWKINPVWSTTFLTRYSLDQNKNFETSIGVAYTQQCWGVKLVYTDTPNDQKIVLSVSLKGIGEF
jgi:LPS-assembly protein